jgi:RNA polymerase sigma factor (TIGR02999 family)
MDRTAETTELLQAWAAGDEGAGSRLIARVYPQLRRLAAAQLRSVGSDEALQPTEVAHEAYLKLIDQKRTDWRSRAHFFAITTRLIRRILLNHARDHRRRKRGGGTVRVRLDDVELEVPATAIDLIALDDALERLAGVDERAARVVELRYFGGLTIDEVAATLAVGPATVERQWRSARVWLRAHLERAQPEVADGE